MDEATIQNLKDLVDLKDEKQILRLMNKNKNLTLPIITPFLLKTACMNGNTSLASICMNHFPHPNIGSDKNELITFLSDKTNDDNYDILKMLIDSTKDKCPDSFGKAIIKAVRSDSVRNTKLLSPHCHPQYLIRSIVVSSSLAAVPNRYPHIDKIAHVKITRHLLSMISASDAQKYLMGNQDVLPGVMDFIKEQKYFIDKKSLDKNISIKMDRNAVVKKKKVM